jgi:hypothetical protein
MARVKGAPSKIDAPFGLVEHQGIRLAYAVLKKYKQRATHHNSPNDNTQDDIHRPYLLQNSLAAKRLPTGDVDAARKVRTIILNLKVERD